jgi:hypothetical protein
MKRIYVKNIHDINRELDRIRQLLERHDTSLDERILLQGAQQALCWALGQNARAPSGCVTAPTRRGARRVTEE